MELHGKRHAPVDNAVWTNSDSVRAGGLLDAYEAAHAAGGQ